MSAEKPAKSEVAAPNLASRAMQTLGPLSALLIIIVLFAALDGAFGEGKFFTFRNARTVTIQSCTVAVAALGMTVIIISGGIDLSCGTAIALSATVLAYGLREDVGHVITRGDSYASAAKKLKEAESRLAQAKPDDKSRWEESVDQQRQCLARIVLDKLKLVPEDNPLYQTLQRQLKELQPPHYAAGLFRPVDGVPNAPSTVWWALLMGIGTGVLCGAINGALISSLRVVPFIITLGTMTIFLGTGNWLSNDIPVRPLLKTQVPQFLQGLLSNSSDHFIAGFPLGVWIALVSAILLAIVLKFSVFGRYVFALGSNEQTARLCGISVGWNKLAVYALGGLFMGLAGVLQFSRLSSGNPMSGQGLELQVIAAVVIGGGSLSGGRGSVLGTLAGAAIMAVIISGGMQLGMKNSLQYVLLGVVIISAAAIDQVRQRMSA